MTKYLKIYWLAALLGVSSFFPCYVLAEETLLHVPAESGNLERVKQLLAEEAGVNLKLHDGWTPLHRAASKDRVEVAKLLIAYGADVNAQLETGETPLDEAVPYLGRSSAMVAMLLSHGANLNVTSQVPHSFLHRAVWAGNADVVEFLLKNGSDANGTYQDGWTLADRAKDEGYKDIVALLTQYGGKVSKDPVTMAPKVPRVLLHQSRQEQMATADGFLFLFYMVDYFSMESNSEVSPQVDKPILLSQGCQIKSKHEFVSDDWKSNSRAPELFDFVVNWTINLDQQPKNVFYDPLVMEVYETWEVYKVATPTVIQKWTKSYDIDAPLILDRFKEFARNEVGKIVRPQRSPIIKEICSFIKQHFEPAQE